MRVVAGLTQLNLEGLPGGTYLVRLLDESMLPVGERKLLLHH